jgi:hypothetical protein
MKPEEEEEEEEEKEKRYAMRIALFSLRAIASSFLRAGSIR